MLLPVLVLVLVVAAVEAPRAANVASETGHHRVLAPHGRCQQTAEERDQLERHLVQSSAPKPKDCTEMLLTLS